MNIIGIDPGVTGGIAFYDGDWHVEPMPAIPAGKKRELDFAMIRRKLSGFSSGKVTVFIEKVSPVPKGSAMSAFTFGAGWGMLQGLCTGLVLPFQLIPAQTWQKTMTGGKGKSKFPKITILTAHRLFPYLAETIRDHDGMADALLIGEYGRRLMSR